VSRMLRGCGPALGLRGAMSISVGTLTVRLASVKRADIEREAAATIQAVLRLVASGELSASSPREVAMVRRLEGAAMALGEVSTHR
jgi:hypothetical protein